MAKKTLTLAAAVLVGLSFSAHAGNGYLGLSVGNQNYQEPDIGTSVHALALTGRLGYRLARFLDVEARIGSGLEADDGNRAFRPQYLAGIYAKLNWQPMSNRHFELYVVGGKTRIRAAIGPVGNTLIENDDATSYGLGIDLFGNRTTALNLEWMRYGDGEIGTANTAYALDVLSIGLVHHF